MALPSSKLQEQLVKIRQEAEERDARKKADDSGLPYLDITTTPVKVDVLRLLDEETARKAKVAVFEMKKPVIGLVVLDPKSKETNEVISNFKKQGFEVRLFITSMRGLEHIWSFYRFATPEKSSITSRVNIEKKRVSELAEKLISIKKVSEEVNSFDFDGSSVTEFLEIILSGALANRTSDIHFEPEEKNLKVRFRIDGVLQDVSGTLPSKHYKAITSRIKLLSNLKLNVSDRPQDGRFTIGLATKDIELRVAIAPSEFGEIIVMRVLDPDAINITLPELGFRKDDLEIIETELKRPNGMILNTGPTGSGKTTTLYAFLKSKHNPEIKIITIEDPIEYHLQGIEQTQIDEEAGYTFADGLRSIMRQDPDVILVGEVRDKETAEIAIQAALTGHLVFSTIHANEAAGAIPRLLDLDVKSSSIGPSLNLIIAQRLIRRLCKECKESVTVTEDQANKINNFLKTLPKRVDQSPYKKITLFKPKGCDHCGGSGFKGRVAIFELLLNDPHFEKIKNNEAQNELGSEKNLEQLIEKKSSESEIMNYAIKEQGMVTMQQDGFLKVITGMTTFEEVEEVTGLI